MTITETPYTIVIWHLDNDGRLWNMHYSGYTRRKAMLKFKAMMKDHRKRLPIKKVKI